jgi:heptosyltransferase-3
MLDEDKMAQTITALQQDGHTVVLTAGPDKKELAMIDRILAASPKTASSRWQVN